MRIEDDFIMLPTVDLCFKELMQNPKVRKGFLAALIHVRPESIRQTVLLPTIMRQDNSNAKLGILDVRILLDNESQMDLEMQVFYFRHWDKRVLFYFSKMYADQIRKGDSYAKLKKCIHVSILDFVQFPEDGQCYRSFHIRDDCTGELYSDLLEIHVLELPKVPEETSSDPEILRWMRFFSGKNREELAAMAKTDEYLGEAYHTLLELSADDKKRLEYEAREKALLDYNSLMEDAVERGTEIGLARGLTQGEKIGFERGEKAGTEKTLQIIRLHHRGQSAEEIAAACGISPEDVCSILAALDE